MALTPQQEENFKRMFKAVYQQRPDWLIDRLLSTFNDAQKDGAYDFLRASIINYLDDQKAISDAASQEAEQRKTLFPPRA